MAYPTLKEIEREAIIDTLRITKGDIVKASKMLGVGRATIYRRLKRYGVAILKGTREVVTS